MPLGAISPCDPSWRKASRYLRIGRDDLRVVRTAALGIRFLRMEGVVPRPQADKTGHAVNRNTAGETTASRSTTCCGWRESNPRLNLGKVT